MILEPDQEKSIVSPEQLQHQTVEVHYRFPEAIHYEKRTGISFEEHINTQTLTTSDKVFQHQKEPIPILTEIDGLVSQSAATDSFKKAMRTLTLSVYVGGRKPTNPTRDSFLYERDELLREVLQLENGSKTGIYTPDGAQKGEDILYKFVQHQLVASTVVAVDLGATSEEIGDYDVFGEWGTPGEIKALMEKWEKEYFALYGKQAPGR